MDLILLQNYIKRGYESKNRSNPLDKFNDDELVETYRFNKIAIQSICEIVKNIHQSEHREQNLTLENKVLIALKFYATGGSCRQIAETMGVEKTTVSNVIQAFTSELNSKASDFIKFPQEQEELSEVKRKFYDIARFPSVVGAIDGPHIPILNPSSDNDRLYINRHGYPSINVQAVCNADLMFTNIVAKYPGSVHDSFIFCNSGIFELFESKEISGYLLGDSGYPLKGYLMTPIPNAQEDSEIQFNSAHMRTRNTIERCFGVLKSRFQCVGKNGGPLRYPPDKAVKIILCAAILHNIARKYKITDQIPMEAEVDNAQCQVQETNDGKEARRELLAFFKSTSYGKILILKILHILNLGKVLQ